MVTLNLLVKHNLVRCYAYGVVIVLSLLFSFAEASPALIPRQSDSFSTTLNNISSASNALKQYNVRSDTSRWSVHRSCPAANVTMIAKYLAESAYLGNAMSNWVPGSADHYTFIAYYYWGQQSSYNPYADELLGNLNNFNALHQGKFNSYFWWYRIFCTDKGDPDDIELDPKLQGKCARERGLAAFTIPSNDGGGRILQRIYLCPRFWGAHEMSSDLNTQREDLGKVMSPSQIYGSRAYLLFHEQWHFKWIINKAYQIGDNLPNGTPCYGINNVYNAARTYNAEATRLIADAYAIVGLVMYWSQTFNLPVSYRLTPDQTASQANNPDLDVTFDTIPANTDSSLGFDTTGNGTGNSLGLNSTLARRFTTVSPATSGIDPSIYAGITLPGNDCSSGALCKSCNYLSSCGSKSYWMPLDNYAGYTGWDNAVSAFCSRVDGSVVNSTVPYLTMSTKIGIDQGKDPRQSNNMKSAYLNFEIHYKQGSNSPVHIVHASLCKQYFSLLAMSPPSSCANTNCYGGSFASGGHDDTKGGTFQLGSQAISYHGLGGSSPVVSTLDSPVFSKNAQTSSDPGDGSPFDGGSPLVDK